MENLIGLDAGELEQLALAAAEPRYRGRQLYRGIYRRRAAGLAALTDLSLGFRRQLAERYDIAYPEIRQRVISRDGSIRYVLGLDDGQQVESVYMPDEKRVTLCISSQAGCAVDCQFCFTALMGLRRNLTAGEIVGQALAILADRAIPPQSRLNVVLMGMGEPLLNYAPVMKAVRLLADDEGAAIPARRITLSTAGIVPRIYDLGREPVRPKLAVSLNGSTDEQRQALMPLNRKYPLRDLLAACRHYPLRPRERVTFEYVMLNGVNDADADAERVGALVRGINCRINLIPYNSGARLAYRASPLDRVLAFQDILHRHGAPAFIRISRGQDIQAACGQLLVESTAACGSAANAVQPPVAYTDSGHHTSG